ncbi:DEAD/DEAH box helicase family protein [Ruminiclostridium cellobioparum]|uniref:DEAD/DEAH box helicase family protein n=1 Tax=Ruminiclostridium cellobioparum TaxID=29355 RepID=UPI0028A8ECD6|nr:DEAD/DEAH box helicase family protein [Ruminiclostridium cellobioparum]
MKLFPFQLNASKQIADRFRAYMEDPLPRTRQSIVPFYQNLTSITGSGKTVILADAVEQIRCQLPVEPIVLWLSKGRVVVWQTYANLSTGKYSSLLGGYKVKPLLECKQEDIEQADSGLILVATVGKFNQKDMEKGDRKVFQVELDKADTSLWEQLRVRKDSRGIRRSFIIVYDEGHNLSDQQTELLLQLEPDALISASATMRIPEKLNKMLNRLRDDKGWSDSDFLTYVKSTDVVNSGLIKKHISLGGYVTTMEVAIDDMLDTMSKVTAAANDLGLPFNPKAIYVSNTNIIAGTSEKDNIMVPFEYRKSRPILIWRHLVNERGVDPSEIAVYCDLKFDTKFPPPLELKLFSGGDTDYDEFIKGDFKHIIFNLTLQEGWDDPACYFAYIDKDMGSKDQVTQVIGRVLRQPDARHYPFNALNTAHFYIRTDDKSVFKEILNEVNDKITSEIPDITITFHKGGTGSGEKPTVAPRKKKTVPEVNIDSKYAADPVRKVVDLIEDYRTDTVNTVGKGNRVQVLQTIGSGKTAKEEWVEIEHSNRVPARWIFIREVERFYGEAVNLCDIEDPKFDAMVEYTSRAAENIRDAARKVVSEYAEHSMIVQDSIASYNVDEVAVNKSDMVEFNYSVHPGYSKSNFNKFELKFAQALDKAKKDWIRNPSKSFFDIPLLDGGNTKNFNPDFLVWSTNALIAIDTKGDHLIHVDSIRKLFHIKKVRKGPELYIRLVTEGKWNTDKIKIGSNGYTVWKLKESRPTPIWCQDINEAVQVCMITDDVK